MLVPAATNPVLDSMKFCLIDRIVELTRGERIVAVKAVSLAEEYLADHFPKFPVLPGVLMLEAMTEAATWLVRDALDFTPGPILLRSAKNVTYKSFVRPGQLLTLEVTCRCLEDEKSEFAGVGRCSDVEVVRARFDLTHRRNGRQPDSSALATAEESTALRRRFALLRR